ncbi:MAG: hypothetical protein WC602_04665 [archaeon]
MAQSDSFAKRKNILDIRHQKYMNYFNIFAISMITIAFSSAIGFFSKNLSFEYFATFIFLDAIIFGFLSIAAHQKMAGVFKEILSL